LGKTRENHEDLGSVGAVGCYLSHYKVWNQIIEDDQPAIIVEDDLLCHPLMDEFELAKNTAPLTQYDFILLASMVRENQLVPLQNKSQGIYPYHGMFFLLHFYYLTPHGAKFFSTGALPIKYQVDSFMSFKLKQDLTFRSAVHKPDMGTQSDSTTDIQTLMSGTNVTEMAIYHYLVIHNSPVKWGLIMALFWLLILYALAKLIQVTTH
jgi:GR25 family glycosyltransferase involved in LPS biosynthesis